MPEKARSYWMIVTSPANYERTRALRFTQQGMKRKHLRKAERMMPGDGICWYVTGAQTFAATGRVTSPYFEGAKAIWVSDGAPDTSPACASRGAGGRAGEGVGGEPAAKLRRPEVAETSWHRVQERARGASTALSRGRGMSVNETASSSPSAATTTSSGGLRTRSCSVRRGFDNAHRRGRGCERQRDHAPYERPAAPASPSCPAAREGPREAAPAATVVIATAACADFEIDRSRACSRRAGRAEPGRRGRRPSLRAGPG
jgi:hypothetical protein